MCLRAAIVVSALSCALIASGCADKESAKRAHLEKADALAAKGNYTEAILEYRNALKVDKRMGEARYKLAEAYVKTNDVQQAAREFVRAADLLPDRADAQVRAAGILLAARQFEAARKYAENALRVDPTSVEAQILAANALAGLNDVASAVRELEQAIQTAPGDARPLLSLGGVNASAGKTKEAEAAFQKAVEIAPRSVMARLGQGFYFWSIDRLSEAEAALRTAVELDGNHVLANRTLATFYLTQLRDADAVAPLTRLSTAGDVDAAITLGDLYARSGKADAARRLYEQGLSDRRAQTRAVARLAGLEYDAQKRDDAYRRLDTALKAAPLDADLLVRKAQFLILEGRHPEAVDLARKATANGSTSAAAHYTLGVAEHAVGNTDAAIQALNEALRLNPASPGADMRLARIFLARGDAAAALKHAEAALKLQPQSAEIRVDRAAALLATKNVVAAETELKLLAAQFPDRPAVHSLYGQALMAKGDVAGAARAFDRALTLNPTDPQALAGRLVLDVHAGRPDDGRARLQHARRTIEDAPELLLLAARFELSAGNEAGAEKYLRQALEKDPANLDTYQTLGEMYMRQQRLDAALKEFQHIVQRKPDSVPARTMIGMILDVQQKPDEALKVYESIVNGSTRAPVAANNLAWIYASRNQRLNEALQLAQDAKQLLPDRAEVDDTLGWVYYKKDLPELAIKAFETSVRRDPKNVMYRFHLGLAYAKAGQAVKARETLEAALKMRPDFDGADEARKTLASLKG